MSELNILCVRPTHGEFQKQPAAANSKRNNILKCIFAYQGDNKVGIRNCLPSEQRRDKRRTREHFRLILQHLHLLPVRNQIHLNILLITYKALSILTPSYLTDLLHHHSSNRHLWLSKVTKQI